MKTLYCKYDGIRFCRVIFLQETIRKIDIKIPILDLGEIEISGVVHQK
jgi:hypothetical protein